MLERAGYGVTESYPRGTLPLTDLKVSYDQKVRYSTMTFHVSRELGERLPVPGGFYNNIPIYGTLAGSRTNGRSIYVMRIDGDRGEDILRLRIDLPEITSPIG